MSQFDVVAVLMVLVALFSYLNCRVVKLPTSVGLMLSSLLFAGGLALASSCDPAVARWVSAFVGRIDLEEAVLHGMLAFLLFAGALHVDLGLLSRHKLSVAMLASAGVLLSTALVAALSWCVSTLLGLGLRPIDTLLFGALISPTDPIAVLGLLKRLGAPEPLKVQIAGESLFNDGVGAVLFLGLLSYAQGGSAAGGGQVIWLFVRAVAGGAMFGLSAGMLAYLLFRSVDDYQVEILLSLALAAGGYAAADALHLSAPIAVVVAGLLIGSRGRGFAMSAVTTQRLDQFWELVDEFLNATLFVAIGLVVLALNLSALYLVAGALAVPVVLAARWASVRFLVLVLGKWQRFEPMAVPILTWGGLRGGISVALVLSLPAAFPNQSVPVRDVLVTVTYVVVTFSILVQGLTIGPLARRWFARPGNSARPHDPASHNPRIECS